MTKHIEIPKTKSAWQARRRTLTRILWDLLLGGEIPAPHPFPVQTVAKGAMAERLMAKAVDYDYSVFPDDRQNYPRLAFKWDGPVTWDTSILSYPGWPGEPPQRAILRVPRKLDARAPAVLCLHGHMRGCLTGKEEPAHFAVALTAQGFVTLAPDAACFGNRRNKAWEETEIRDCKGYSFLGERDLAMPLILQGRTLQGVMTWEQMRSVDVLCRLPFVDPRRIGCTGMSMGGVHTVWLAALDKRIACGVEACGFSAYEVIARKRVIHALYNYIPHLLRHTDTGEIGGLIAPRPFLCLDGARDDSFPLEAIRAAAKPMRAIYRLMGAADRFRQSIHPGGHAFTPAHMQLAMDWFAHWLNPGNSALGG